MNINKCEIGGEQDFCSNCDNDGDDNILYLIEGTTNKYICETCYYEYEEALQVVTNFKNLNDFVQKQ